MLKCKLDSYLTMFQMPTRKEGRKEGRKERQKDRKTDRQTELKTDHITSPTLGWDLAEWLERCDSIPKITASNPSGGSEFTFRSDLLLTARGGST
jgi:hypothetical protein